MAPIRMEAHLSVIQDNVQGGLIVEFTSCVEGFEKHTSTVQIGGTQVYTRLQEVVNNSLRGPCGEVEELMRRQRKGS